METALERDFLAKRKTNIYFFYISCVVSIMIEFKNKKDFFRIFEIIKIYLFYLNGIILSQSLIMLCF